ncbi:UNVERIFIED_CONTAM: GDSL esterase/lipase CPRD49 [Sesamum latifolium]|uniref:GDSL esterase/lipase CPRD49 n=1 Tax=Sesamum latifolium TaxID=2727402 RepID=A0AAW2VAT4_9LAMI
MVGPSRPKFVLFGSSIVQMGYNVGGWSAVLADLYARKADVLLRGYSGWNSRMALQALDRIFPKDAAVQPSLVVVYFGGNDATNPHPSGLGGHVSLPEYVDNMKKIIVHLKSLSDKTRIICLGSPPVNEAKVRKDLMTKPGQMKPAAYSEALVELCKELDVEAINLWTAFQQRDDWANACLVDGIHLSAEGSKVVVAEILKVLKKANWEPSLYWLSMPSEFPEDSPYYIVDPDEHSFYGSQYYTIFRFIPVPDALFFLEIEILFSNEVRSAHFKD